MLWSVLRLLFGLFYDPIVNGDVEVSKTRKQVGQRMQSVWNKKVFKIRREPSFTKFRGFTSQDVSKQSSTATKTRKQKNEMREKSAKTQNTLLFSSLFRFSVFVVSCCSKFLLPFASKIGQRHPKNYIIGNQWKLRKQKKNKKTLQCSYFLVALRFLYDAVFVSLDTPPSPVWYYCFSDFPFAEIFVKSQLWSTLAGFQLRNQDSCGSRQLRTPSCRIPLRNPGTPWWNPTSAVADSDFIRSSWNWWTNMYRNTWCTKSPGLLSPCEANIAYWIGDHMFLSREISCGPLSVRKKRGKVWKFSVLRYFLFCFLVILKSHWLQKPL